MFEYLLYMIVIIQTQIMVENCKVVVENLML